MSDTLDIDGTARAIADNVFAAYSREAEGAIQPGMEQSVLARLVEAIREEVPGGTPRDILDTANAVLDAFEEQNSEVRGPRASALNRADGSVSMVAAQA